MKKIARRCISLFLALTIVFGVFLTDSSNRISANAATTIGGTLENIYWSVNEKTGELIIGGTGPMPSGSPWYKYDSKIKTIKISYGVTTISDYAFSEMKHFTSITIPGTVVTIGYRAFSFSSGMKEIYLPLSCELMGFAAFYCCFSLTDVYYEGNSTQFDEIDKVYYGVGGFEDLLEAKKHYNYDYEALNEPKDFAEYSIKIADSTTNHPIPDATVTFDGNNYTTDKYGNVKITALSSNKAKPITISCNNYHSQSTYLYLMDEHSQNTIKLSSKFIIIDPLNAITDKFKINGPSVLIKDEEVPLFTMELSVDLAKLFELEDPLSKGSNAYIDRANQTIEIIIGAKEGYCATNDEEEWHKNFQKYKDYYKTFSQSQNYNELLSKYNDICDSLKDKKLDLGVSADGTVGGYLILDYSSGQLKVLEGGAVFKASSKYEAEYPFGTFFYAAMSLSGELDGKLTAKTTATGTVGFNFKTEFELKAAIGVGAKLLAKELLGAELGIEGAIIFGIDVPGENIEDILTVSTQLSGYFKMYFLTREIINANVKSAKCQIYPTDNESSSGNEPSGSPSLEVDRDYIIQSYQSDFQNQFEEMKRSRSSLVRTRAIMAETSTIEEFDVFPNTAPQIESLSDGRMVAVWIKDDGSKSDANRTSLYYSIYSDGLWSVPAALSYSEFGDYSPKLCSDGNNAYIVWQRMTKVLEDGYSMEEALENSSLVFSSFDGQAFSAPVVIDASGKFQETYSIAAKNGKIIVAWTQNTENDLSGSTGNNLLLKRVFSDGAWSEAEQLGAGYSINEYITAFDGETPAVVMIVDSDGSYETIDDGLLYIDNRQISESTALIYSLSYQNGNIYWINNKNLHSYADGTDTNTGLKLTTYNNYFVQEKNGAVDSVVYSVSNSYVSELYILYNNGQFTNPVKLTSYEKNIADYDVATNSDGKLWSFLCLDNIDLSTERVFTTTDMICAPITDVTEIVIDGYITYDIENTYPGATENFCVPLANTGTTVIDGVQITVTDTKGTDILSENLDTNLIPGERTDINLSCVLPETLCLTDLNFSVTAKNSINTSTQTLTLGYADLAISECTMANGTIIYSIVNNGYADASDVIVTITSAETDSVLSSFSIDNLGPGEKTSYSYNVPEEYLSVDEYYLSNRFCVSVKNSSAESNYSNNDASALSLPTATTGIYVNKSAIVLQLGESDVLKATVYPENALDKNVVWISDSTDVATVDKNGMISTHTTGTAKISAITVDGDFTAECIVTVHSDSTGLTVTGVENQMLCGLTYKLSATLSPDTTDETIIWESSDASVLEIDNAGNAVPKQKGTAVLTVMSSRGSVCQSFEIEVLGLTVDTSNKNLYHIANTNDLLLFNKMVSSGISFSGKTIQLDKNLDLSDIVWEQMKGSFSGTFDGNNHILSGFNCAQTGSANAGFFSSVYNGCVKNLTIKGSVSGSTRVGMLSAAASYSVLSNCKAIGQVSRTGSIKVAYIGGLVGDAYGSTIINCAAETDVHVNFETSASLVNAGGLVGYASYSIDTPMSILNSYCIGDIFLGETEFKDNCRYYVGGIVGNLCGADMVNNYYYGEITNYGNDSTRKIGYVIGYADPECFSEYIKNGTDQIMVKNNFYPEGCTDIASLAEGEWQTDSWTTPVNKKSISSVSGEDSLVEQLNIGNDEVDGLICAYKETVTDSNWRTLTIDNDSLAAFNWYLGSESVPVFYIENVTKGYIKLHTPTTRYLKYGENINLYVSCNGLPEGSKIKWHIIDGEGVSLKPSSSGKVCSVTSKSNGDAVIEVYVVDKHGNSIIDENGNKLCDREGVSSEVNLWLIIIHLIKKVLEQNNILTQFLR